MILTQASWIILSVLAAMCMGGFLLISQYFKTPGQYLVIWSRLMVLTALAPLPFFLPWPEDPRFYIAVGITGFIASWADLHVMNVSARLGVGSFRACSRWASA